MSLQLLSHEEVQKEELLILEAFDLFTKNHGLTYTLMYGTLIGAVRHHGYIPWDDDIDVGMPRPDYQWLIAHRSELETETGFKLETIKGLAFSNSLMCKLVNTSIQVEEWGGTDAEYLWMDIFPIDSLPEDDVDCKRLCSRIVRKEIIFIALTSPISSARTLSRRIVKALIKPIGLIIKPSILAEEINGLAQSIPYGSTSMVSALTWSYYGYEGRFPLELIENTKQVQFEELIVSIMDEPGINLGGIYGDYMQVPDPSKRETHSLKAWRI